MATSSSWRALAIDLCARIGDRDHQRARASRSCIKAAHPDGAAALEEKLVYNAEKD
jgi:hypothetical protein